MLFFACVYCVALFFAVETNFITNALLSEKDLLAIASIVDASENRTDAKMQILLEEVKTLLEASEKRLTGVIRAGFQLRDKRFS